MHNSVFITSDTHFHHGNIIKYSNRPFSDSREMNEEIISRWNSKIGPDDLVYHLGDFSFGREDYHFNSVFNRLNGKIVFIEGNHDSLTRRHRHRFYNYHYGYHEAVIGGQMIVMSHYPIIVWNKKHRDSIMVHGHTHYNLPATRKEANCIGKILDVGVDGNNFTPYSLDEIMEIMKKKDKFPENPIFNDHHSDP